MAIQPGVNVSNLKTYALPAVEAGVGVSKVVTYVVMAPDTIHPGVNVSNLKTYAETAVEVGVNFSNLKSYVIFSPTAVLAIVCDNPPDGQVGVPYTHTLIVTGGVPPYTFTLLDGSLPPGLSLTTDTGIIYGVPTAEGFYSFTVQVFDSLGANVTCTIRIIAAFTGAFANVYTLKDYKLTDDDYGQIFPYYVTYFAPTAEQEEALQLGGGRKMLSYLSAFIESNSYLYIGCNLEVTFYCDTLLNPWALTVSRVLPPNAIFDMECGGGAAQGQRIAVKFASSPRTGQTDNALNLQRVTLFVKVDQRKPVRGSST